MPTEHSPNTDVDLAPYHSFGLHHQARYFAHISDATQLTALRPYFTAHDPFVLGGGSNTAFITDTSRFVLHNTIKGIKKTADTPEFAYYEVASAENWDQWVQYALKQGVYGLENLSFIPGTVGAAPIQNIGAYGVEAKDYIIKVNTINLLNGKKHQWSAHECQFSYRHSVFKDQNCHEFISSVVFKLPKHYQPQLNYQGIQTELQRLQINQPTSKQLRELIGQIRARKLPDPSIIPNAGSFFKNPIVNKNQLQKLLEKHPSMPHYPINNTQEKISAAWLIEACGFKGKNIKNVGVYDQHALVIIRTGKATGAELYNLATQIKQSVKARFQLQLTEEVQLIDC